MIAAVHEALAPLGLSVARIVLQPDPFDCLLWPGAESQIRCQPATIPGTAMHGWVTFTGSDKVAAVSLSFQVSAGSSPAPSPSWVATVAAFQVPPAGFVMPAASTPSLTPSPSVMVDCGPLAPDRCASAVAVAEGAFSPPHGPFTSVRMLAPSAVMTCPPSGGPEGAHICSLIAIISTADGSQTLGLVPGGQNGDWVPSNLVR